MKGLKKLTASRLVCDLSQLLCTLVATALSLSEHLTSCVSHHATSAHNFKTLSTKHVMRLEKVFIERELFWYCTNLSSPICEEMCIGEKGELQCSERKAVYLMILRYNSSTCKLCLNNLPILREYQDKTWIFFCKIYIRILINVSNWELWIVVQWLDKEECEIKKWLFSSFVPVEKAGLHCWQGSCLHKLGELLCWKLCHLFQTPLHLSF